MCLLVVLSRMHAEFPLVVGANRDELLDRPAVPMTVLRANDPRILGGRDELAGGTWLAVNQAGVVAGLTNRPTPGRRDPDKRSRGELPLALASHTTAAAAVDAFVTQCRPSDFNPSWLLVGDRDVLFFVDMTGDDVAVVEELPPGLHVLENRPLRPPSPKSAHVQELVGPIGDLPEADLVRRLGAVLANHDIPAGVAEPVEAGSIVIPPEVKAACVHTERYGTRWSSVTLVPRRPELPTVRFADGPPCTTAYVDAGKFWQS